MEGLPIPQHSIQDYEKLAGDRDDGKLSRLSGSDEGFEERFEARRMADRNEGSDVKRIAHPLATASDRALATPCSAVVVERSEARQGGELLGRVAAELGHEGKQGRGSDGTDARHRDEQAAVVLEFGLVGDYRGDLRFDGFDRRVEPDKMRRNALARDRIGAFALSRAPCWRLATS